MHGLRTFVCNFIHECETCQRNKAENVSPAGLLKPLQIQTTIWTDITLDFIDGLLRLQGHDVIIVVVDRLSKYAHFIAPSHPYTTTTIAHLFIDHIFRLHGMPQSIVSDRDPKFTSSFWRELFCLQGTHLNLTLAYHPQCDGQLEVVNRCLETYLRVFVGARSK